MPRTSLVILSDPFTGNGHWTVVNTKQATNNLTANYIYGDKNIWEQIGVAIIYYRLKEVNANNTYIYSEVKALHSSESTLAKISIWPNPATDHLNILMGNSCEYQLSITDMQGKTIYIQNTNGNRQELNIEALSKGIYMLVVKDAITTQTQTYRFEKL
ncbi:MAG: T9SS type A sorting domain-containing protein [Bacteroidota bacterium]|nr:T9SS type A sorting domain-containing protein [Bacteroidota bacterium]